MANLRKNNYSKQPTSQRRELRKTESIIKNIEKAQEQKGVSEKLKITLANGTRFTLSQAEYEQEFFCERWSALCDCLSAGDSIEVISSAGKIIGCEINFFSKAFYVEKLQENEQEIYLTCYDDSQKEEVIAIRKVDIEKKTLIVKDISCNSLTWDEIILLSEVCAQYRFGEIKVYYVDEKVRCVEFCNY